MNLLYMKYAVEVAAAGSINRAAERLYLDQPNLSRAIRELETSLGVTLFERSARGMRVTADGELFLRYARSILSEVEAVETLLHTHAGHRRQFSVAVPHADYAAAAFAVFSRPLMDEGEVELTYRECQATEAMQCVWEQGCSLAVLRYAEEYDAYYKAAMEEKGLVYELVTEFQPILLVSRASPLAERETVTRAELLALTEIALAPSGVPTLPASQVRRQEHPPVGRRLLVCERASQLLLLQEPGTYLWSSPVTQHTLDRYGLVERTVEDQSRLYKDMLVYRADHKLTSLDNAFITALCQQRRAAFHK